MQVPANKKIVCITGTIWTGSQSAPRRLLVKEGFCRPVWFTTSRRITDAEYELITTTDFHLALSRQEVLVSMQYGRDYVGIFNSAFEKALNESERGVLVVSPHEIAARMAERFPRLIVFALKDESMELSDDLEMLAQRGQLHPIDVNVLESGAWSAVNARILEQLGIPHHQTVI